jgi:hypothetical protein
LVYHIAAGKVIEYGICYHILNKYSVFMLLIVIASLVGISSIYQPAEVETQLLQPAPASPPLPGVVDTQLLIPELPPPQGLPPIQPPGLPPLSLSPPTPQASPPTTSPQQGSSG